jgi:uncharacterized membrane protein
MASLSQAKTLGGVGSILALLAIIPSVGWIIAIVGLVLVVVAVKYISDVVQDAPIFRNMVIGIGIAIVGAIVGGLIVLGGIFRFLGSLAGLTSLTSLTTATSTAAIPSGVFGLLAAVLIGAAVLWIVLIVSAIFVRMSYNEISKRLNVGMFRTAALLYLIGAILTVILVGLIIVFVAEILLVVAFFSIPETLPGVSQTMPPPPPSPMQTGTPSMSQPMSSGRTCPHCGAPVSQDAVFCPSCGSSLKQ